VTSKVLNASEFGSPQARQRIFIVAAQGPAFPIPDGTGETRTVETILDPSVDFNELNGDKYQLEPRPSAERNPAKPKIL
jgi:site-specific DNA-cytosine methylase